MKCAFFDCNLSSEKDFLGDDNKLIPLCLGHYKIVDEAVKRRFKE